MTSTSLLLQRLVIDEFRGIGPDPDSTIELPHALDTTCHLLSVLREEARLCGRTIRLAEKMGRMTSPSIEVVALGTVDALDRLGDPAVIPVGREPLLVTREAMVAWISLPMGEDDFDPLLLVRASLGEDEISAMLRLFLRD